MSQNVSVFDRAVRTSEMWLDDVAQVFGTDDRRFAQRVVRAWLHAVRDRLTVAEAVRFGAQLPELFRGVYYEGWNPTRVPVRYGPDEFVSRFAREAMIAEADVRWTAARVSLVMQSHLSSGQLDEALAKLPPWLRDIIGGVDLAILR